MAQSPAINLQKTQSKPWQALYRNAVAFIAHWLYRKRRQQALPALRSQPKSPATSSTCIVCISDTHNARPKVPDDDVLLHTGNLTNKGTFAELQAQLTWLQSLPHRYKLVIAGNHDLLLDPAFAERHPDRIPDDSCGDGTSLDDLNWGDLIYLNDRSVTLDFPCLSQLESITTSNLDASREKRTLRIYGAPWTEQCGVFAFQYPPVRERVWANRIPDDTDIVMVHGPPKGHCDMGGKGCPQLLREIRRAQPKLVVCGHIHGGYGQDDIIHNKVEAAYNAAELGDRGLMGVVALFWCLVSEKLVGWLSSGHHIKSTHLVNAALMIGLGADGKPSLREPVVVQL